MASANPFLTKLAIELASAPAARLSGANSVSAVVTADQSPHGSPSGPFGHVVCGPPAPREFSRLVPTVQRRIGRGMGCPRLFLGGHRPLVLRPRRVIDVNQ